MFVPNFKILSQVVSEKSLTEKKLTRMMFIKHNAPNRCLCNVQLITGVRIAEMSQLQNCSVMSTKKGSYFENDKKEIKSQGGGVRGMCVQRMEAIVKRKKSWGGGGGGGGQGRCERGVGQGRC